VRWRVDAGEPRLGRMRLRRHRRTGAGSVERLRWRRRRSALGGGLPHVGSFLGSSTPSGSSPSSSSPPFLPRPSLLGGGGGTGENTPGALGFRGCGGGLLIRAALGLWRVGTTVMLGFHATATRHASGGCRNGARVSGGAQAVKVRWKGARRQLRSFVAEQGRCGAGRSK
jgi:hypothetical protein